MAAGTLHIARCHCRKRFFWDNVSFIHQPFLNDVRPSKNWRCAMQYTAAIWLKYFILLFANLLLFSYFTLLLPFLLISSSGCRSSPSSLLPLILLLLLYFFSFFSSSFPSGLRLNQILESFYFNHTADFKELQIISYVLLN